MDKEKTNGDFTPPDGGYGWIIVLSTTMINISLLPLVQCFGIIYKQDFDSMGITSAETSFMLHLHSAIYCSLGMLGSPLLKKYDFRRVAFFGSSLMCLGIFLSSFAKSYGILICTFSVLIGIGQGIMLPATYLATNTYFKKRLTLAVSFSVTGASISHIIMPPICHKLLAQFGRTQSTVLVLSALSILALVFCCFLKPMGKLQNEEMGNNMKQQMTEPKEELELLNLPNQVYKETTLPVEKEKSVFVKLHELFNLELLSDRPYVIAIVGMSLSFASELNIILMMSFILPDLAKFARQDVAYALSVQAIADIFGRLAIPLVAHYFSVSARVMYVTSLTTSTIARILMANFYASKEVIFFCISLIGLAKGIKAVYQSVIIPKYVSLEKLPAANGLNMLLTGGLSLALGPILGLIHDASASYVYTLHAASILSMSCVVLWIVHYLMFERKLNAVPVTS